MRRASSEEMSRRGSEFLMSVANLELAPSPDRANKISTDCPVFFLCYNNLMKTLKFIPELRDMILAGEKDTTWRPFDDKNLKSGDVIELLTSGTQEKFATAVAVEVKSKTFGELDNDDWDGHEKFSSKKEMFETYTKYMQRPVTPESPLKIVKLKIIE